MDFDSSHLQQPTAQAKEQLGEQPHELRNEETPLIASAPTDLLKFLDDDDWDVDPENIKKLTEKYADQEFPLLTDELPRKQMKSSIYSISNLASFADVK